MNAQKGDLWLRICHRADHCGRTKTDVFPSVFLQNGRVALMQQKSIIIRTKQCERGLKVEMVPYRRDLKPLLYDNFKQFEAVLLVVNKNCLHVHLGYKSVETML